MDRLEFRNWEQHVTTCGNIMNHWEHPTVLNLVFSVFKNEILVPNTIAFGPWVFLLY